ncbi:unnamed protein product [Prorocentrum cordatum]|uniref:Uncharacterized protein n=1 Tax=Prorocentrum cordatum TaxID=2364126 RepID=A0ABN9SH83_9DINO|nr:unnamed protein product [Polarella glacialis]
MPFYILSSTMGAEEASAKIAALLPGLADGFAAGSPRLKIGPVAGAAAAVAGRAPAGAKLHLFARPDVAGELREQDGAGLWAIHEAASEEGLREMTETLIWGLYMRGVMDGCSDEVDPVTGKLTAN